MKNSLYGWAQLIEIFVRHMVRKTAAIIGCPGHPRTGQLKLKSLRCYFRVSKPKNKRTSGDEPADSFIIMYFTLMSDLFFQLTPSLGLSNAIFLMLDCMSSFSTTC